ncbi:form3 [Trypoxylus dichotomus]
MKDCKESKTPTERGNLIIPNQTDSTESEVQHKPIRELIGSLMYLMLATRPDLSTAVNIYSRYQQNPSEQVWMGLKRILRYLKGTANFELFYPKNSEIELVGFADADCAGDQEDRKSTTGYLSGYLYK